MGIIICGICFDIFCHHIWILYKYQQPEIFRISLHIVYLMLSLLLCCVGVSLPDNRDALRLSRRTHSRSLQTSTYSPYKYLYMHIMYSWNHIVSETLSLMPLALTVPPNCCWELSLVVAAYLDRVMRLFCKLSAKWISRNVKSSPTQVIEIRDITVCCVWHGIYRTLSALPCRQFKDTKSMALWSNKGHHRAYSLERTSA